MEHDKITTDELVTAIADGPNVMQSVDTDNRIVEFIISSETIIEGRGYVVRQDGLDISQIKKNPVFLWLHDAYGYTISGGMPVGKILTNTFRQLEIRAGGKKVKATAVKVQFPTQEEFPLGHQVYKLYAAGYLNAVSIGFRVMQITEPTKAGDPREFTKWKLGELSGVAIGADDEALIVKRAQSLNRDEAEAKQMFSDLMVIQSKAAEKAGMKQEDIPAITGHFMDVGEHTILVRTNDEDAFQQFHAELQKRSNWYDENRPALLEANKAMVKFFKIRGEKQPEDLEQAYIRMGEIIEQEADEPTNADQPLPQSRVETPPAKPASKPGVVIPEIALKAAHLDISEQVKQAALEASAKGMSDAKVKIFTEQLYTQLFSEFVSKFRSL